MSWDQIYYYLDKVFDKEFNNMVRLPFCKMPS